MLDSGFMPPLHLCSNDRNVMGGGCAVATRENTAVLLYTDENHFLNYILYLMQFFVAHKAITSPKFFDHLLRSPFFDRFF